MRYTDYNVDQIPQYMYNIVNNFAVCFNPDATQSFKGPYELEYICINNLHKNDKYLDVVVSFIHSY